MRKLATALFSICVASPALADNLCAPSENKLFECRFEKSRKSVSICQSKTEQRKILYKFGTPENIQMELPNEKSGAPYIVYDQFGPSSFPFINQIVFPLGKARYTVSTPQGIAAALHVDGIRKPYSMWCDQGDSGGSIVETYLLMENLNFKKKIRSF